MVFTVLLKVNIHKMYKLDVGTQCFKAAVKTETVRMNVSGNSTADAKWSVYIYSMSAQVEAFSPSIMPQTCQCGKEKVNC